MSRQVAILHGWSDNSKSFVPLPEFLKKHGYRAVPIFLGDYISLRDDVNIDDVAKRMEEVVRAKMARPITARDHLGREFDLSCPQHGRTCGAEMDRLKLLGSSLPREKPAHVSARQFRFQVSPYRTLHAGAYRDKSHRSLFIDRFDLMREGGFYSQVPGGY